MEHHKENIESPLLLLSNFDPVKSVVLDSMHLLYAGVMKTLIEKWISRNSATRLKIVYFNRLNDRMQSLSTIIPNEFQRKKFDLNLIAHWKATQYRFFLHYCGVIVLKDILPDDLFKHFMLLFVASRILDSNDLILIARQYDNDLLRTFFCVLPPLYGTFSQVLNMHSLIHIADDVEHTRLPLCDTSAFWGENFIGAFKKLVKSPKKPLTQIVNRLSELETSERSRMTKNYDVSECVVHQEMELCTHNDIKMINVTRVKIRRATFSSNCPNNIVQLKNKKIFKIEKICLNYHRDPRKRQQLHDLFLYGCEEELRENLFDYPTASADLGIVIISSFQKSKKFVAAELIQNKCVFFLYDCDQRGIAILLQHM